MAGDYPSYPGATPGGSWADRYLTALAASNAISSNPPKLPDIFGSSYAPARTINALAEQAMQAVAGEGEPIPEIYGTARVAARVATVAGDATNNLIYLLCVWCGGPVEAVNKVLIGGVEVASARMQHHLGTAGQSADSWLAGLLTGYTDALAGICYTVISARPRTRSIRASSARSRGATTSMTRAARRAPATATTRRCAWRT